MIARPLVRYHGGKWLLAPWILEHFPAHRVYVEPFGGGGSVLLRKQRSYAEVYNDLDGEMVNLFRVARDHGNALVARLAATPFARDEFIESYEPSADPVEQARRTVVRSFMGFGSNAHNRKTGFRACAIRSGTTPARDWSNYPEALTSIVARLQGVVIENRDALEVMAQHDSPETLHYVDPPYVPDTRDPGEDYAHEMSEAEHVDMLRRLLLMSGHVVLSGYRNDIYDDLLTDWRRVDRRAFADGARARAESLWLSPSINLGADLFTPSPADGEQSKETGDE